MESKLRFPLLVLAQSLLTSVVLTWPHVLHLGDRALGSPHGDTLKHLWTLWSTRKMTLSTEGGLLHNAYINHPGGLDLWPIEPLHGLVAAALPGLSLVALSNLQILLNLTLDGLVAALLVREVSGSRLAASVAALLLQGSSFALFAIEVGVGELQHLWLLPLAFWSLLRLVRSPRPGWMFASGAILGMTVLACFYHGLFVALGCIVLALFELARSSDRRRLLGRLLVTAALGIAIAAMPLAAFSSSYGDQPNRAESLVEHVLHGGDTFEVLNPPETRLQLAELVAGGSAKHSDAPNDLAYGGGRILGVPLLLLVLLAVARNPREVMPWLVMSGAAILLSMGAHPVSSGPGHALVVSDTVALPFLYLNRALGWFNLQIHFPARFLALAQVGLAVTGSTAIAHLSGRTAILATALAALNPLDVNMRQVVPRPLSSFALPDLEGVEALSTHQGHALLDLSYLWLDNLHNRHTALAAQLQHEHPVNTIALERIDHFDRGGLERTCALRLPHKLHADFVGLGSNETVLDSQFNFNADFYMLERWGFQEIMIGLPAGTVPARLTSILGPAQIETDRLMIWQVPTRETTEEEGTLWREEYGKRLVHVRENGCPFGTEALSVMAPMGAPNALIVPAPIVPAPIVPAPIVPAPVVPAPNYPNPIHPPPASDSSPLETR